MDNEIKLTKLEGFSFEVDKAKIQEGLFSWSGNYVLKLRLDPKTKKIYCTLYYANIDYRVQKARAKKQKDENQEVEPDVSTIELF